MGVYFRLFFQFRNFFDFSLRLKCKEFFLLCAYRCSGFYTFHITESFHLLKVENRNYRFSSHCKANSSLRKGTAYVCSLPMTFTSLNLKHNYTIEIQMKKATIESNFEFEYSRLGVCYVTEINLK
ncbi:hypothetical protein Mapa_007987 [Marchantia paleacea]|nr:hypothetical protein Mapa_007987 [Marchantia paleacea]